MKAKPEWLVYGALAVGLALRLSIASSDDGIYWPDEVYQSLEPAHRLVFGYGFVAWEFIEGARNWALPGLVAALMALAKGLGLDSPHQYLMVVRLAFSLGSVACAYGVWRLARALDAKPWPAALASAAAALYAVGLYFGHRAMSENASAVTVVLGLWLVVEAGRARTGVEPAGAKPAEAEARRLRLRRWLGVSLLGLSVLLRLQTGLFCVALLVCQVLKRRWREALESLAVLGAWAFVFGLLDHLTWAQAPGARFGGWFHSAVKYLEFNLVQGRGASWGTASFGYYLHTLWTAMPPLFVVLLLGSLLALRKAPFVFTSAVLFVLVHSLIPHKELRFLLPVLPLFFALAAVGLSQLPGGRPHAAGLAALALAAGFSLARHRALTFGDLGAYPEKAGASAWDDFGPANRLLEKAGALSDLCGLRAPAHLAWVGGYSYLHKNVPLYMPNVPPDGRYNYAVVPRGSGLAAVAQDGPFELVKVFDRCNPDPGFSWRLP